MVNVRLVIGRSVGFLIFDSTGTGFDSNAFENNKSLVRQPIKQQRRRSLPVGSSFSLWLAVRSDCYSLPFAAAVAVYAILVNHRRYNKVK